MGPAAAGPDNLSPDGRQGYDWGMLSVMSLLLVVVNVVGVAACHRSALSERSLFLQREMAQKASTTDSLTGMANRRSWEGRLDVAWCSCVERAEPFSLLTIDIDHFKTVNDTLGHSAGDTVLRDLADALWSASASGDELAARLGGDEFALMLPGRDVQAATRIAVLIQAEFRARMTRLQGIEGVEQPTLSIGALTVDRPMSGERGEAVEAADGLLYKAKRAGRDRILSGVLVAGTMTQSNGGLRPEGDDLAQRRVAAGVVRVATSGGGEPPDPERAL